MEAFRSVGFLLAFVVGACLVGFCISWPLWFFSTKAPEAYTITALSLLGCGIAALIVRGFLRKRSAVEDLSKQRTTFLTVILTVFIVVVGIGGAFAAVAFFARRLWTWGALDILLWVALLWLLGRVRRRAKTRKAAAFPAENLN